MNRLFKLPLVMLSLAAIGGAGTLVAQVTPGSSTPPTTVPTVPSNWQTFAAKTHFTFKAPPDVKNVPAEGMDSYIGQYDSESIRISFDYGQYSDPLDSTGSKSRDVNIDGKPARYTTAEDHVGIHFADVGGGKGLTMTVRARDAKKAPLDPALAEAILLSIDFQQ